MRLSSANALTQNIHTLSRSTDSSELMQHASEMHTYYTTNMLPDSSTKKLGRRNFDMLKNILRKLLLFTGLIISSILTALPVYIVSETAEKIIYLEKGTSEKIWIASSIFIFFILVFMLYPLETKEKEEEENNS